MTSGLFLKSSAIILFGLFATLSAQEGQAGRVATPIVPLSAQPTRADLPEVKIRDLDAAVKEMIVKSTATQVAQRMVTPLPAATRVPTPKDVRSNQPYWKPFHELEVGEAPGTEFTPVPREPLQTTPTEGEPGFVD